MTNDQLTKLTPQQLQEIKKKLLEKRERLKEELKTKHADVYKWLVDRNIDLDNLQKYSKNIAAALALTSRLLFTKLQPAPVPTPVPSTAIEKNLEEFKLAKLTGEQKAKRVWQLYGNTIDITAQKYNVDPQLIFATIMTESEGNTWAYRYEEHINDASYGLGQVLYSTALRLGFRGRPEKLYRPKTGIDFIGRYHRDTIDTYGLLTPEQMTIVYNTGTLFASPYPGHLARFYDWYYTYSDTRKLAKKP